MSNEPIIPYLFTLILFLATKMSHINYQWNMHLDNNGFPDNKKGTEGASDLLPTVDPKLTLRKKLPRELIHVQLRNKDGYSSSITLPVTITVNLPN